MGCLGNPVFCHIAQTGLFMGIFFSHSGGVRKQFGTNLNCPWGARQVKSDPGVVGLRPKSVYLYLFMFSPYFQGFH